MTNESLYGRLGGYDAIAAVINELMRRIGNDPRLAKYFAGHGEDSKKRLRQMQVEMICQAIGGPCFYMGRDMKTIHEGMGISGTDWQVLVTHLVGVLDSFNVADAEQKEVLNLLNGIKGDIVEKP